MRVPLGDLAKQYESIGTKIDAAVRLCGAP
jgi:hypothetical protein